MQIFRFLLYGRGEHTAQDVELDIKKTMNLTLKITYFSEASSKVLQSLLVILAIKRQRKT